MNIRIRLFVLFVLLAAGGASAQSLSQRAEKDDIAYMQNEEPAMRRAFSLARASLDDFLAKVKAPPKGTSSYAVKVGVREGKNTEYFWMNELKFGDGKYAARVNNEPRLVTSVEYGEIYHFSKSQIVDWMYIDKANKKMMGNFTACALLTKEPKEQAEEFKKQYGLTCE